jgi:hypothetical protein
MIGKSSYEGYRNLRDPDDVLLSNVITSSIPPDGPVSSKLKFEPHTPISVDGHLEIIVQTRL